MKKHLSLGAANSVRSGRGSGLSGEVLKTQVLAQGRDGWSPERQERLGRGPRSGVDAGTPCREARPSWAQVRAPGLGQPKAGGRLG